MSAIDEVIKLLEDMRDEAVIAKNADEAQHDEYVEARSRIAQEGEDNAAEAQSQKDGIEADIAQHNLDLEGLPALIEQHERDVAAKEAEISAEHARHVEAVRTLRDSQQTLWKLEVSVGEALDVIEAKQGSWWQGSDLQVASAQTLTQLAASVQNLTQLPASARSALGSFLAQGNRRNDLGEGVAGRDEILQTLQEMRTKLEQDMASLTGSMESEDEVFERDMPILEADLQGFKTALTTARDRLSELETNIHEADVQLEPLQATIDAETQKMLDAQQAKAAAEEAYGRRKTTRESEIAALNEAIEDLQAETGRVADLTALQKGLVKRATLAMLRVPQDQISNVEKAHQYIVEKARSLGSSVFQMLASGVRRDDPFVEVRGLIEDLIRRLEAEAATETNHNEWCVEEMNRVDASRTETEREVKTAKADVASLEAGINLLAVDIDDLEERKEEQEGNIETLGTEREAERKLNEETIETANQAHEGVSAAVIVLKGFYDGQIASSASAIQYDEHVNGTAALSKDHKGKDPEGNYTGMHGHATGVFALLDVIKSDIERLRDETTAAEEAAVAEYGRMTNQINLSIESMENLTAAKSEEKNIKNGTLTTRQSELAASEADLAAINVEHDGLQAACVQGSSYEDRLARRNADIEGLQDVLRILEGEER